MSEGARTRISIFEGGLGQCSGLSRGDRRNYIWQGNSLVHEMDGWKIRGFRVSKIWLSRWL